MKLVSVILPCLLLRLGAMPLPAADWPQYRGPAGDGTTPERLPAAPWPKDGPRRLWRADAGTGFSSFAIAGGKAFTIAGRQIDGVQREVCLALDAATGKELWAAPCGLARYDRGGDSGAPDNTGGDGPRSTPAVSEGRVYVYGAAMNLRCLDARTGTNLWTKDIIRDFDGRNIRWQSAASPVLDGGLLFVAGGGAGQSLLALDKKTGETVWKTQDDAVTHSTPVVAVIHGVRQVIFFTQRGLVAADVRDGTILWRHEHPFRTAAGASPVVAGDIVYCSSGYGAGAAAVKVSKEGNAFQAALLWRKANQLMNHWATPVVRDGFLYGLFGQAAYGRAPLVCVELATGTEKWSRPGFGPGGVILSGDQLLVLADNGDLVRVKATPEAYTEENRFKALAGKCWSVPAFSGGKVFLRSTLEGACYDLSAE
jgi:outer membrane protein assembly factor BamB